MAVTLLPDELPNGAVAVEIAWGADLAAPASWTWTDITADVRHDPPIEITTGRADEASTSQPAKMKATLDNTSGAYSLGWRSPNYPNVRPNVPVRVRIDLGAGFETLYIGYATGFTPAWNLRANVPTVALVAAGTLRREQQRRKLERSCLRRWIPAHTSPVAYWPLEDGDTADEGVPVAGRAPMVFRQLAGADGTPVGKVKWAAADDNPALSQAPELAAGGSLHGAVDSATLRTIGSSTGGWTLAWAMRFPATSGARVIMHTDHFEPPLTIELRFFTDGFIEGTATTDDPLGGTTVLGYQLPPDQIDGVWHWYEYSWILSDADTIVSTLDVDGVTVDTVTVSTLPTPAGLCHVQFTSSPGTEDPIAVGHVTVMPREHWLLDGSRLSDAAGGFVGERATDRITRLAGERGVPMTVVGVSDTPMGPQFPDTFLALLRECETADQGILLDGFGAGLSYAARETRENAAPALTLDVSAAELGESFEPTDDDQRTVNQATAKQREGSEVTVSDEDSVAAIGLYDTDIDVNVAGVRLADYAGWAVHLGTTEGYRYPQVTVNLRAAPSLAPSALGTVPSSVIELVNVRGVFGELADDTIRLVVEGTQHTISPYQWTVTYKCSPADAWRIAVYAGSLGDRGEYLAVLDTEDSELVLDESAGATFVTVETLSGPRWTLDPASFPFEAEIGGVPVEVIEITDPTAGGSQVFEVSPLPRDVPAGSKVRVRNPPVLGLV